MAGHTSIATVHLELDSRPESVTLVRAMLAGAARHLGIGGERLDDLRTAVSEACNNVVLHAYEGEPGPLLIDVALEPGEVRVKVLDRGSGIRSIISPQNRMRVGLPLISALADRAQVLTPPGGGTEVRMVFADGENQPASDPDRLAELDVPDLAALDGGVVAFITPVDLLAAVLGRICAAIALQANFSVDRHADLDLVADELSALAHRAADGTGIGFSVRAGERCVHLRVGPLPAGSCAPVHEPAAGRAAPLRLLADCIAVETANGTETLKLRMADRRDRPSEPTVGGMV